MSLLLLNVTDLLRRPGSEKVVHLETSTAELDVDDGRIPEGPVSVELRLDVLTDGIVVNGVVSTTWQGQCRRCLVPVGGSLTVEVSELYQTTVIDPEAFPIVHDQLDARPMVREALLIEAPAAPLCREGCAGICAGCGADRNQQPCGCRSAPRDDRWAALDALREDSR